MFVPLFSRAYWLEAASMDKHWDVATAADGAAMLAYHYVRRWGMHWVLMPQLTQTASAVVADAADAEAVLPALVESLEKQLRQQRVVYAYLQGHWSQPFRAALQAHGYEVRERVTYRIAAGTDKETLLKRFSQNKRRQLSKACDMHLVHLQVDEFYAFHSTCLAERGKRIVYSADYARQLLGAAQAHQNALLLGAKNAAGELLAAVGLVYDEQTCYYLLPTYAEAHKKSGAMAWLTTEAIMWAMQQGLTFDFEGSMVPSIARSYREFGGQPVTYYSAEKYYRPWLRWAIKGYSLIKKMIHS